MIRRLLQRRLLVAIAILALASSAWCVPRLPHVLSDHMVVQQDKPIHVWGWGDAGEQITVTLLDQSRSATADRNGRWSVDLPPRKPGGPFTITVRGKSTIVLKDVLVGEVWVASGQSNMTFALQDAVGGAEAAAKATNPQLRLFTVPKNIAMTPQDDTRASAWQLCTPDNAKSFSAVAYFFARDLQERLGVPVGIIHTSWPGSAGEEWTDDASLRAHPELQPIVERWHAQPADVKRYADEPASFALEYSDFELIPKGSSDDPVPLRMSPQPSDGSGLHGVWDYAWEAAPHTTFEFANPARTASDMAARVSGSIDGTEASELHGTYRTDGAVADLSSYDAIRFWVRGNGMFRFRSLQPTITDWDDYGTDMIRANADWTQIDIRFADLKQESWGVQLPFTANALSGFRLENYSAVGAPGRPPSGLYNGMIAPLLKYVLRGAIWYQGEGNAGRSYQYRTLLPSMIAAWRAAWNEGDFPFGVVQLPGYGTRPAEPSDSGWAELREAQSMAQRLPNVGVAVTIDLGDAANVHPHRKAEVGERLAHWALATVYRENIEYTAPVYESMRAEGNQIRLSFSHIGSGFQARGDKLRGFAVAGADRRFQWADARVDGNTIVVSSPDVSSPVAVRYAWGDDPDCNLFGANGLPVSPFRTDTWPGVTAGKN